jgi:hypothetical protein
MALAGNIKEFGLADIFQIVSLQQKTGELIVESSQGNVTVLLDKGLIVGADASFRPIEERLEQSLLQSHQLTKFQLKRARENQKKTHQPFWTALAEVGDIDPGAVQRALSQQIHETVYHLLRWTEGEYRFEPRKVEYDQHLISPVNTEFLVMEGFRITDEWSQFEKDIPSLQVLVRRTQGSVSPEALEDVEKRIYELLEAEKTIQDLADIGQLGEFDACQTVYELMKKGWVEKVPGKKGQKVKVRRPVLDLKALLAKAAIFVAGLAAIGGVVVGVRMLPRDVVLIHRPNLDGFAAIAPLATRSRLQNAAYYVAVFFVETGRQPASLDDLVSSGAIPDPEVLRDAWGQTIALVTDQTPLLVSSPGLDGIPGTADDITVAAPF